MATLTVPRSTDLSVGHAVVLRHGRACRAGRGYLSVGVAEALVVGGRARVRLDRPPRAATAGVPVRVGRPYQLLADGTVAGWAVPAPAGSRCVYALADAGEGEPVRVALAAPAGGRSPRREQQQHRQPAASRAARRDPPTAGRAGSRTDTMGKSDTGPTKAERQRARAKQYERRVAELKAGGMPGSKAHQTAARENPRGHLAYLRACNPGKAVV